jgi:serine/threonine protein kinase
MYTSHALTTGFLLQGSKYKISKVLGNGGFGITYLATHNFLEKQVAIKEVYSPTFCKRNNDGTLTGLSDNFDVFKRNFFAEARTLAKFSNNKNIVQVSDIFNENNTIYFVMDYVEGHSLQEFIDKKGILPFSQAIKYTIDILTALIEVHQNNILHRDIKPANLLIRNTDKEIILIDFGIAREFTQDETLTQTAMISVGYAPPEQSVSSHKRTASMDLYSVGAVLYFCLTGKRPQTNNELSVQDYISAKQLNSAIPKTLDDLISKAIKQKPHKRFQSAEEMIKSLRDLSEDNVPKIEKTQKIVKKENLVTEKKSNDNKKVVISTVETPSKITQIRLPLFLIICLIVLDTFVDYPNKAETAITILFIIPFLMLIALFINRQNTTPLHVIISLLVLGFQFYDSLIDWNEIHKFNSENQGVVFNIDWSSFTTYTVFYIVISFLYAFLFEKYFSNRKVMDWTFVIITVVLINTIIVVSNYNQYAAYIFGGLLAIIVVIVFEKIK